MDEFIVMTNHVHGLLYLSGQEKSFEMESEIARSNKTRSIASLQQGGITGINNPVLNPLSLSKIIRWYKGRVTFEISRRDAIHRVLNNNFQWQPRFHDRIVRDEIELYNVRNYIANNPRNWEDDEFYT
ncbi:MAG: transposase [Leptospiraceae bacterium]|nr:transposase [Leptospiraceae bacterium]